PFARALAWGTLRTDVSVSDTVVIWLAGPEMGSAGVTRRPRTGRRHERARTGHRHGRGLHDGEGRGDRSREQGDLVARLPAPSHQAAREMSRAARDDLGGVPRPTDRALPDLCDGLGLRPLVRPHRREVRAGG